MRDAVPTSLRGVVAFCGSGLDTPQPSGTRADNSRADLACVTLRRGGAVRRFFPIAASAPHGVAGTLVLDIGSMEI